MQRIDDRATLALGKLPSQFKDSEKLKEYFRCFLEPFQDIEDALHDIHTGFSIEHGVGFVLDLIGKIVLEPRRGRDDEEYKRHLRARIKARKSSGVINHLIRVVTLVVGDAEVHVAPVPEYPAQLVMRLEGKEVPVQVASDVARFLDVAKSEGVRVILWYMTHEPEETFAFDGAEGKGFGDGFFSTAVEVS